MAYKKPYTSYAVLKSETINQIVKAKYTVRDAFSRDGNEVIGDTIDIDEMFLKLYDNENDEFYFVHFNIPSVKSELEMRLNDNIEDYTI
jgi:hypothetical protein